MQYPSFEEYSDALQLNLGIVLSDPLLSRGKLRMHGPGLPVAHSGNFALTFEVCADGRTYAIRCFHKHSDSLQARYDAIASHLRSISSPYFVEFDFQPRGITTESGEYPVVRMEWADGQTLAAFVAGHRSDVNALQQLRVSLRRLARHLREHGIAHGDIQPTNVIVQGGMNLRLIDYDGMFVPQLATLQSAELGQCNFQHPGRCSWHFNADLDAFSFSLLDLALDALCRRPDLWDRSGSDADAFILRAADITDPASSPVFRLLAAVPGLERRVKHFAAICVSPFDRIPAFEDFLGGRNIPAVSVVLSGDPTMPLRRRYVSIYDIVDATNFARCCAHVGDRVELIGRIVRVVMSRAPQPDTTCLRVEFAEHSNDMVCLKIWPDALAALEQVPDETWVGQWVCAVGLVEPVCSAGSGLQRQKDVSISITEPSQLHRLTEAEARYRLGGHRRPAGAALDTTAGIRTDRVVTDAAPPPLIAARPESRVEPHPTLQPEPLAQPPASSPLPLPPVLRAPIDERSSRRAAPLPPAGDASGPLARGAVNDGPGSTSRRPWWIAAAMIASLSVYALVSMRTSREPVPEVRRSGEVSESTRSWTGTLRPALDSAASRLESRQDPGVAPSPIETAAATLVIGAAGDAGQARIVLLDGVAVPGLRDDSITLAHRAEFPDREVVVGFTQCNGAAAPCGLRQPFWLELRAGLPPMVRRAPGLWASTGAGSVSVAGGGVRVDLGVWNGERRNATLTAAGNIVVARARAPSRALNRADCETVVQAAEACATGRDCSSFASSASPIPSYRWARLTRLYHESTGLDAVAFRALCVRSCQLGLTPSRGFIRRHACSGAQPDQWPPGDPAAGLIRRGA